MASLPAPSQERGDANCSMVVDDMTEHEHVAGRNC